MFIAPGSSLIVPLRRSGMYMDDGRAHGAPLERGMNMI
jgi:hypothetical protein